MQMLERKVEGDLNTSHWYQYMQPCLPTTSNSCIASTHTTARLLRWKVNNFPGALVHNAYNIRISADHAQFLNESTTGHEKPYEKVEQAVSIGSIASQHCEDIFTATREMPKQRQPKGTLSPVKKRQYSWVAAIIVVIRDAVSGANRSSVHASGNEPEPTKAARRIAARPFKVSDRHGRY
jgi:hypothetical protein